MTKYNTNNPPGSASPKDVNDNAITLDNLVNSTDITTKDRLGNDRLTIKGLEQAATSAGPTIEAASKAVEQANLAREAAENIQHKSDEAIKSITESAMQSQQAAIISTDAAKRAESAAQGAGEDTRTFETVELGIAATQHSDYFRVWQTGSSGVSFAYYRNNNGHAELLTTMPTAETAQNAVEQAIDANNAPARAGLQPNLEDDYLYILADKSGRVLQRLDADLVMRFYHQLSIDSTNIGSVGNVSGFISGESAIVGSDLSGGAYTGNLHISDDDSAVYVLTDAVGRVLLTIDKNGKLSALLHDDVIEQVKHAQSLKPRIMSDLVHIQMYGQSLSVGIAGAIKTTNAEVKDCLMPSQGIEDGQTSNQGIESLPLTSSSFVTMQPSVNPNQLENPIYSLSAQLQSLLDADGKQVSVVGSSAGHGDYAINQLDKEGNSQQYSVAVAQHGAYKQYASSMGKSFLTHVLCWIQGET
ncbi:hypothetical protein QP597_20145, partial [Providencia stuartii]|uniref:hypothetical protein n=1 Tax=Providencia stuartii TaxID=588 RepID=UPI0028823A1F